MTLSWPVLVAAIPAPPTNILRLGPLSFHIYGLCIAAGALAGVALARKRWADGGRDPDDITSVALVAVPAGLVGARLYHVITDYPDLYSGGRWWPDAFFIWKGGLGIPGGVIGGVIGALIAAHYKKMPWREMGDATAPALPLAQAIGRLGNYFNQELFGSRTSLPWGLKVDMGVPGRPFDAPPDALFHPTFLYEALWNLALVAFIVVAGRRIRLRPGRWFPVYILGYGLGRLWVESLRIDEANKILGLRINIWTSLFAICGGLVWLFWRGSPLAHSAEPTLESVGTDALAVEQTPDPDGEREDPARVESSVGAVDRAKASVPDGVGETGPDPDGPLPEGSVAEGYTAETGDGIDPEHRT